MGSLKQLIDIIYLNIAQKIGQAPGSQYDWHFLKAKECEERKVFERTVAGAVNVKHEEDWI